MLARLGFRLQEFYQSYTFQDKAPGELTPYLWPRFIDVAKLHEQYIPGGGTSPVSLADSLKRQLLYSHRVIVYDALPFLLDYFRLAPEGDVAAEHKPSVVRVLRDYAAIAPLLRHRIVVPFAMEDYIGGPSRVFLLDDVEEVELGQLRNTGLAHKIVRAIGSIVKEQLWLKAITKDNCDPYFPNQHYPRVFASLLRAGERNFSSEDIREPFRLGTIAEVRAVDVDRIKIADVIAVRQQAAEFAEFRNTLRSILNDVENFKGEFSDFEKQFAEMAQERCRAKLAELEAKVTRSRFLPTLFESADKIAFGAAVGVFTAATTQNLWVSLIAGGARPA